MDSPTQSQSSSSGPPSPTDTYTPATEASILLDDNLRTLLENVPAHDRYILITGGLGFIGSHTTLELLKAGYNVIVIDNMTNSYQEVFKRIQMLAMKHHDGNGTQMPSIELHEHDYRDTTQLRALLRRYENRSRLGSPQSKIKGVIHFAAHKSVEESIKDPLKYYANNVSGLVEFVDILGVFGIKTFIFSSSATVYGTLANSGVPLEEGLCIHSQDSETDTQPGCVGITNPYGRTKWMCEAILADVAASDPTWTVVALRYFNPIGCDPSGLLGEDPRGVPTNLLPVVIKVLTGELQELKIFGSDWDTPDGTAVRDFIHVTDLARGHIAALSTAIEGSLQSNFRTFNLGTGHGHTVMEVVSAMESASSRKIAKKAVGRRAGDVGTCVAAAGRSAKELNWKTERSLADACADAWNFLKTRGTLV
ncbi:UDP-glucose 4-epimerase GalE [Helicocarpus griseus UAMH5409]|uniref:UDP-glucose 4-epimerase GalE n=1 Tax=Helicocarpus griseus UAMH5409 TaxID=1447875 RepID=A0A2B7XL50_9EURO|nr:UDP-glucose 4-epimerase GalE [Helicocarpus griseus UAMH5409]